MEALPPADYSRLVESLLNTLECRWQRNVRDSGACIPDGPCWVHPDGTVPCQGAKGVSYMVETGFLQGTWGASGADADRVIFDEMLERLEAGWRHHLAEFGRIAAAMRSVGR